MAKVQAPEQQRVRIAARLVFQKHLLRFRRAEQMRRFGERNAELVLTNSHDALCACVLKVGIFRRICSNGLVLSRPVSWGDGLANGQWRRG